MNCLPCVGHRKHEKVEAQTKQAEKTYADFWQEGDVFTVSEFLKTSGFDLARFPTLDDQVEFVEKERVCHFCEQSLE